jgi:hypothetical protein
MNARFLLVAVVAYLGMLSSAPADPATETAPQILRKVIDANRFWLDEATNSHDGKVVLEMKISDVSVAPIPGGKFDTTVAPDDGKPPVQKPDDRSKSD